jgi:antitoxin (DNA-binding transcriptional repressor) of toxin-antitoxin stability system
MCRPFFLVDLFGGRPPAACFSKHLAINLAKGRFMAQFSVHSAKTNLSKLIATALEGEEVVIARGNIPMVRLVPIRPLGKRSFGAFKGEIAMDDRFNEPLPESELDAWHT